MGLQTNDVSPQTIVRLPDVLRMTGRSRSTLYIKIKRREFPHQVSLGTRAVGWIEQEVQNWIDWRAHLRLESESEIHPAWKSESAREITKSRSERAPAQERPTEAQRFPESSDGKVSAKSGHPDPRQLVLEDAKLYFDKSTHTFWPHLLPDIPAGERPCPNEASALSFSTICICLLTFDLPKIRAGRVRLNPGFDPRYLRLSNIFNDLRIIGSSGTGCKSSVL